MAIIIMIIRFLRSILNFFIFVKNFIFKKRNVHNLNETTATSTSSLVPLSVNYHLTRVCNYKCGFCFHTALTSFVLPLHEAKKGLKMLHETGMKKINFSGGEPFIVQGGTFLGELVKFCKTELQPLSVSIVSNGSLIKEFWMKKYGQYVDILAISCDSFDEDVNRTIGRYQNGKKHVEKLMKIREWCSKYEIAFKINTVVNAYNIEEDFTENISLLKPIRWKVFQCLLLEGENIGVDAMRNAEKFYISDEHFEQFLQRHSHLKCLVPESNIKMRNSYLILDEYFYGMVERNEPVNSILKHWQCTVFAPTNLAFQGIDPKQNEGDYLVPYHISNTPSTLKELELTIPTIAENNPPLWISKVQKSNFKDSGYTPKNYTKYDIYVNNARINMERSDYVGSIIQSNRKKIQVLHVIEEVLQPLIKKDGSPTGNPDAYQFLEQHQQFNIGPYSVRNFLNFVKAAKREVVYTTEGRNTFFIPIDSPLQVTDPKGNKIDVKVIDGHVIPGSVLFTNPTSEDVSYRTLAFSDFIKVMISFQSERSRKVTETPIKKYVTSKTIVGDEHHPDGAVLANIVRPNIPVRNGVIHLINRPLMVVDDTVVQFLESYEAFRDESGFLSEFLKVLRAYGRELLTKLSTGPNTYTIFAPINDAWKDAGVQIALKNETLMRDIVNLHVVQDRYSTMTIREKFHKEIPTLAHQKHLYFNVLPRSDSNFSVTVEGGGTNATILHADIAATNGIIHVIDRVLGIPCSTIESKLATNPQLNLTYTLGKGNFNSRLAKGGNYTFFVPRDHAWSALNMKQPTLFKLLFTPEGQYHAVRILERHLIVDGMLTMADLKNITSISNSVPAFRDHLNIRVRENLANKGYAIQWLNDWINVYRSDIRCTNGIIHIIDEVFLMDSDIKVAGGSSKPDVLDLNMLVCVLVSIMFAALHH